LKVGTLIAEALSVKDTVLEVNVTPNRADALSHLGVAREVAVLTGVPVASPRFTLKEAPTRAQERLRIRIEAPKLCTRYAARVLEQVKVGPSPAWLKARLEACGVRSINNVVDVTNYVMLEYGQPLHAFDLDRLSGPEIVVRLAAPNEKLVTLDGKERALSTEDLLICDAQRAQVLAGVMGGADSEVTAGTQRILLECAHFQPATVRRASKRHGLHSESSHRFERGVDIDAIPEVLDRAAALLAELAQAAVLQGRIDVYPQPRATSAVSLRLDRLSSVLGVDVPVDEVKRILGTLGFVLRDEKQGVITFDIPARRQDVGIEEDLIEEVARIFGYDAIVPKLPKGASALRPQAPTVSAERAIRESLLASGFDEVLNYSFVSEKELEALGAPRGVALKNPLSAEQSVMRTSMFAGLLQNVSRNLRHQVSSGRLYEFGRTYLPRDASGEGDGSVCHESQKVAGVLWGSRSARSWTQKEAPVDFFDAKGAVEGLLEALKAGSIRFEASEGLPCHPRACARIFSKDVLLGSVGELHPKVARAFDVPPGVFVFELDLAALLTVCQGVPKFVPLSKFPSVLRDFAVVVPESLESEKVEKVILEVGQPLVKSASVFDVYQGKPISEGHKSLAFALEYQSTDRTLTDAEVQQAHARIVEEVNRRLGGALRGA
jgi:phenylalanyl-tRNA synthetase beta chain